MGSSRSLDIVSREPAELDDFEAATEGCVNASGNFVGSLGIVYVGRQPLHECFTPRSRYSHAGDGIDGVAVRADQEGI